MFVNHAEIDWSNPVVRSHPLMRGCAVWLLATGPTWGSSVWRNLMRPSYNGTKSSAPVWVAGHGRGFGAMSFDGTDDAIVVTNPGIRLDQPFSTSFWIRSGNTEAWAGVLGRNAFGSTNGFLLADNGAGKIRVNRSSTYSSVYTSSATVFDGTWHHVGFLTDGSNIQWVIDGVPDTASTLTSYSEPANDVYLMGQQGAGSTRFVNGLLDDVRIWTGRSLTTAQMAAVYHESRHGYPETLRRVKRTAYYKVSAPVGGTILPIVNHYMAG